MSGVVLLWALGDDVLGIPTWASGSIALVALTALLILLLQGQLVLKTSVKHQVKQLQQAHEVETKSRSETCDARLASKDTELAALRLQLDSEQRHYEVMQTASRARLDAVIVDRDAWRAAHTEEAAARRAAEHATRQLLESSNVTMGLLAALKDALGAGSDT